MKVIIGYLEKFLKKDFHPLTYGLTLLFLAIFIFYNYEFNFEDGFLDSFFGKPISWLVFFLHFAGTYCIVLLIYVIVGKKPEAFNSTNFWLTTFFIFALLALKVVFYHHYQLLPDDLLPHQRYVFGKTLNRAVNIIIYIIGIGGFYVFFEKYNKNLYGLTTKALDWRPYAIMLLFMVPLLALAATQPDFLDAYPRLSTKYFGENYWKFFALFEPFYLGEFIMVEWFFRGFLVVGMIKLLGHRAILPMAAVYCVFHFGKPLGECISSIFGGYILGVFAYYTRSIWGGVIVHMGIAFLMDLAAIIAKFAF